METNVESVFVNFIKTEDEIKQEPITYADLDLVSDFKEEELPLPSEVVIKEEQFSEDEAVDTCSQSLSASCEGAAKVHEVSAIVCPYCNNPVEGLYFSEHLPHCEEWKIKNARRETHHPNGYQAPRHKVYVNKRKLKKDADLPSRAEPRRAFAGFRFHTHSRSFSPPVDRRPRKPPRTVFEHVCPLTLLDIRALLSRRSPVPGRTRRSHPSLNEGELRAGRRRRTRPSRRSTQPEQDSASSFCLSINSILTDDEAGEEITAAFPYADPAGRFEPTLPVGRRPDDAGRRVHGAFAGISVGADDSAQHTTVVCCERRSQPPLAFPAGRIEPTATFQTPVESHPDDEVVGTYTGHRVDVEVAGRPVGVDISVDSSFATHQSPCLVPKSHSERMDG